MQVKRKFGLAYVHYQNGVKWQVKELGSKESLLGVQHKS
jgi:hypothetical protein